MRSCTYFVNRTSSTESLSSTRHPFFFFSNPTETPTMASPKNTIQVMKEIFDGTLCLFLSSHR